MQRLEDELDRISLHQEPFGDGEGGHKSRKEEKRTRKHHKHKRHRGERGLSPWMSNWPVSYESSLPTREEPFSLADSTTSESSESIASSRFDSAIGSSSLHSQTDHDSLHSQSPTTPTQFTYDFSEQLHSQPLMITSHDIYPSYPQWTQAPPPLSTPDQPAGISDWQKPFSRWRQPKPTSAQSLSSDTAQANSPPWISAHLKLEGSPSSPHSGASNRSSSQSTVPQPEQQHGKPVQQPSPVLRATTKSQEERVQRAHLKGEQENEELQSGSSSSTITTETPSINQVTEDKAQRYAIPGSRAVRFGSAWQQVPLTKTPPRSKKLQPHGESKSAAKAERKSARVRVNTRDETDGWATRFYHENITPQSSPLLPRRYHLSPQIPHRYTNGNSPHRKPVNNPPRRSASILQRLRQRRHGSFKRERRSRIRMPVKRSFSDRITYQVRKRWLDSDEDLYPISNPSLPRHVGRMVKTNSAPFHIVELHRPPSGRYGIYITEGKSGGVYVSRFAEGVAEKFYSGLLGPGDEIVAVNGQSVRDKSLDCVYDLLSSLDSVVLTILPIYARPDWSNW